MSKLNLAGLRLFKKKNDETYLKQNDAVNINNLAEENFVEDDDIILKGQAETGDLVRVKASDFFAKVEEEIGQNATDIAKNTSNIADNTSDISELKSGLNFKMYSTIEALGLDTSTATSLLTITQAMNNIGGNCILFMAVVSSYVSDFYANGIIPISTAGTLEIVYRSRCRAIYVSDQGAMYVCSTSNGISTNFTSWRECTT